MNPTPKLAAIDLDGTLLGANHLISSANADAVQAASAAGMHIVLASGRQWDTISAFAQTLSLPSDAPIIAYNGAMIRTHAGHMIFHQPLPPEAATYIVHYCADHGYHLNYYLNDVLSVKDDTHWGRIYQSRTGTIPRVTGDLTVFDGQTPTKLLLIDTPETTDRLLIEFQAKFGTSLYITKTEDEYLEFMHPDVSKGAALARVAAHLGLTSADCAAFGDSYNDISMLEWAGTGVALGNARPELKAVASIIAPNADDDGVAAILRSWLA